MMQYVYEYDNLNRQLQLLQWVVVLIKKSKMIMLCMFLKHYFLYADWSFVSARSTFKFSLNLIPGAKSVMGKKKKKRWLSLGI